MRRQRLHELAKFGSGLVAGDFLGLLWFATQGIFPVSFLGMQFSSDMILPGLVFDAALFIILVHYGWHIGKTPFLRERTYLLIAGVVFGIVAAAHLIRVFTGIDVAIAGWSIPLWLSWIGTAASAYLSYMSVHLALRMR